MKWTGHEEEFDYSVSLHNGVVHRVTTQGETQEPQCPRFIKTSIIKPATCLWKWDCLEVPMLAKGRSWPSACCLSWPRVSRWPVMATHSTIWYSAVLSIVSSSVGSAFIDLLISTVETRTKTVHEIVEASVPIKPLHFSLAFILFWWLKYLVHRNSTQIKAAISSQKITSKASWDKNSLSCNLCNSVVLWPFHRQAAN